MERSIFKSFLDKVKYMLSSDQPEFNEEIHKPCPECDGYGRDEMSRCHKCKGDGFIEKTYQERHNLQPYKKNI